MSDRCERMARGDEPAVLSDYAVLTSEEDVDGEGFSAVVDYSTREAAAELWVTSRVTLPSGRTYFITEITWTPTDDGGYHARLRGKAE